MHNNNQLNCPTVSGQKDTVTPSINVTQKIQSTDVQRSLGSNQAQSIYQQNNYHGMQQCKYPNPYRVQPQNVNTTAVNQQGQPQMYYQPQQTSGAGFMTHQIGNTSNQHIVTPTGMIQSGQHLKQVMPQTYLRTATQSFVPGANGVTASNNSITNSYGVQQAIMQYPDYNQNYQQSQHQATQIKYQPQQSYKLSKSESVTPKQNFVNSNQFDPTQWSQSNFIPTNQIQSGQHNWQQNSYSDPLNTTIQQQTNSSAQNSSLNYNYQPIPQHDIQNPLISSNSHNSPHKQLNVFGSNQPQFLQAQSGRFQSSLPQTSTQNSSNRNQYTGSNTNS